MPDGRIHYSIFWEVGDTDLFVPSLFSPPSQEISSVLVALRSERRLRFRAI